MALSPFLQILGYYCSFRRSVHHYLLIEFLEPVKNLTSKTMMQRHMPATCSFN